MGHPLRALSPVLALLPLLWEGSLCQGPYPGFTLEAPRSVSVRPGLCAFIPCSFTWSKDGSSSNPLRGYWFKGNANPSRDLPVATNDKNRDILEEARGRFQLVGDVTRGYCSLSIQPAREGDGGTYFFRIEGPTSFSYKSPNYPEQNVSLTATMEKPVLEVPELLRAGQPVNITCTAPGRCVEPRPTFTWTEGLGYTESLPGQPFGDGSWIYSSVMRFTPSREDQNKTLTCNVTYPNGIFTERAVLLSVNYRPQMLKISGNLTSSQTGALQPFTNRSQLMAQEGDSLTLLCTVDSNPPASLSWVREPGNLSLSLGNRLELLNVTSKDRGEYRCRAQNTEGSTEMTFQLIVQWNSLLQKIIYGVSGVIAMAAVAALGFCVFLVFQKFKQKDKSVTSEKRHVDDSAHIYSDPNGTVCNQVEARTTAKAMEVPDPDPKDADELHYASIDFMALNHTQARIVEESNTEYSEIKRK